MARQSTTLTEMREVVQAAFQADPDALANSTAAAHCAVAAIQRHWAGCEGLYIPKLDTLDARDWEMWELYNGANVDDIALRYGLTNRQVRNRLRIIRPIAQAREQRGLFDSYLQEPPNSL